MNLSTPLRSRWRLLDQVKVKVGWMHHSAVFLWSDFADKPYFHSFEWPESSLFSEVLLTRCE